MEFVNNGEIADISADIAVTITEEVCDKFKLPVYNIPCGQCDETFTEEAQELYNDFYDIVFNALSEYGT